MRNNLMSEIEQKYVQAGFNIKTRSADSIVFSNNFSVHFVFLCGEFEQVEGKYSRFHSYFNEEYLTSDCPRDLSWNFYEIYVFEAPESKEFLNFKERTELNLQMSRKYVLTADQCELLPPLHLEVAKKGERASESPWEEEWKTAVGEELYDRIMDAPKTKVESVLKEYLNDKNNHIE